jgi:DegT/DnrJ/EryC1/StrS aminotransferase family
VTERLERAIEALMRDRTGRDCLFVPSGRMALYLAFRIWLSPGDRVLMSPLNDDVVFFTALAAGLRPVMAPLSSEDGNIDPAAVPNATWASLSGVLTTNLYGLPDRLPELRARCNSLGIPLIEDAAHAIATEVDGRPVGAFGDAAAFSMSKHIAGAGGVLAFADGRRRPLLERLREQTTTARSLRQRAVELAKPTGRWVLRRIRLDRPARRARHRLGLSERTAHRMPLRPLALRAAIDTGPDLHRFDPWVRVDLHDYRMRPRPVLLERTLDRLRTLAGDRARRVEGVRALGALDAAVPAAAARPWPLFRVPLLVEGRDALVGELADSGIDVGYIYDPPLDDYAGAAFADPSPAPAVARWWAGHVLPIDPLLAQPVLDALRTVPTGLRPAAVAR